MSPQPQPNFHASLWQHRPAWQSDWHALDTCFDNGQAFLDTLHAWQANKQAPLKLFYTAFSEQAPSRLAPQLAKACYGLLPGIHRISFENSQVQLTLCIGALDINFKEIDIAADSVCIDNFERVTHGVLLDLANWEHRSVGKMLILKHWRNSKPQALLSMNVRHLPFINRTGK
jgi:hypothetical protein